jgi:hypothetical protein
MFSNSDCAINREKIMTKLKFCKYGVQMEEVDRLFAAGKYQEVYEYLSPLFIHTDDLEESSVQLGKYISKFKRLKLLNLITMSCKELQNTQVFNFMSMLLLETLLLINESEDFDKSLEKVMIILIFRSVNFCHIFWS